MFSLVLFLDLEPFVISVWFGRQMTRNTHRSSLAGTLEDGADDEIPNPPPVPPNLAEAIATLTNATTENARFMRELVQNNQN